MRDCLSSVTTAVPLTSVSRESTACQKKDLPLRILRRTTPACSTSRLIILESSLLSAIPMSTSSSQILSYSSKIDFRSSLAVSLPPVQPALDPPQSSPKTYCPVASHPTATEVTPSRSADDYRLTIPTSLSSAGSSTRAGSSRFLISSFLVSGDFLESIRIYDLFQSTPQLVEFESHTDLLQRNQSVHLIMDMILQ